MLSICSKKLTTEKTAKKLAMVKAAMAKYLRRRYRSRILGKRRWNRSRREAPEGGDTGAAGADRLNRIFMRRTPNRVKNGISRAEWAKRRAPRTAKMMLPPQIPSQGGILPSMANFSPAVMKM